jgi:hypothetical protein
MSCKDVSKVPRKRLFEMMECMYLIKLKVEGASDLYDGPTGDDGGNDQGLGDDADMDELDHEDDMLGDKFVGGQSKGGSWMGGGWGWALGILVVRFQGRKELLMVSEDVGQDKDQSNDGGTGSGTPCSLLHPDSGVSRPAWQPSSMTPESSKRVASWASLF